MISAIIILVLLGLMDVMLFLACCELERDRRIDKDERSRR